MHIKHSMEFTSKQNDQLKQLKDMVRLHKLQTKCVKLKDEIENLATRRSECINKQEMLMEHFTSLQEDLKTANIEEYNLQRKLDIVNNFSPDCKNDYVQSICEILGYQTSKYQLMENNGIQVTLYYRDGCYVTYSETANMFDLLEIFPKYLNFTQVQQFLRDTQDIKGLLTCLRKFFDLALKLKENQEVIEI